MIYKIFWVLAAVTAPVNAPLYLPPLLHRFPGKTSPGKRSRKEPGNSSFAQIDGLDSYGRWRSSPWWPGLLNFLGLSGNEWLARYLLARARQRSVAAAYRGHRRGYEMGRPAFHHCAGIVLLPLSARKNSGSRRHRLAAKSGTAIFFRILLGSVVSVCPCRSLSKDLQILMGKMDEEVVDAGLEASGKPFRLSLLITAVDHGKALHLPEDASSWIRGHPLCVGPGLVSL